MNFENPLKQREYVKREGGICPFCEFKDIESDGNIEFDGGTAQQDVLCPLCGARWTDYYRLTAYGDSKPYSGYTTTFSNIVKVFPSRKVAIIDAMNDSRAVVVKVEIGHMWFTKLDSPRIKRIKDPKIRAEVIQALKEIAVTKALSGGTE